MREDVTEIVVNVKGIRLRSYSERGVRLNLSKYGAGEVRAGDIELPANVELVNPELVLANLDGPDAHLEMELTVERGRGYVSFEAREVCLSANTCRRDLLAYTQGELSRRASRR